MRAFKTAVSLLPFCLPFALPAWAADFHVTVGGESQGGDPYYGGGAPALMFSPANLTIQAGDRVIFENAGGFHNVAADDGSFRCAQGCDGDGHGGNGAPSSASWSAVVTFGQPGTFGFHCEIHQAMGMVGRVTVQAPPPPPPAAFDPDQHALTGSWADPGTAAQGVLMEVYPDLAGPGTGVLFGGWFTYDADAAGGQRWYTVQGQVDAASGTATMPIYLTDGGAFDAAQATTLAPVGEATFRFGGCNHADMDFSFSDGSGRSGTLALDRLLQNVDCVEDGGTPPPAGDYLLSGAWADAGDSGQGLVIDVNPPQRVLFAAWYTFLPGADAAAGPAGQHWFTLQAAPADGFADVEDIGIYETRGGAFDRPGDVATDAVGTARLVFHDCGSATLTYSFGAGAAAGRSGTLDLTRVGPIPDGCSL